MPTAAARPCRSFGCTSLVRDGGGYCDKHRQEARRVVEQRRGSSTARGYGYKWQQASKGFLRSHPLCQCADCKEGAVRLLQSEVVDHIIPHNGDMTLFWDRDNWQAMNKQCHDRKTASEDGGFGNQKR